MTAMASLGALRLKALALLGAMFLAGALSGAGLAVAWHRPRPPHAQEGPPGLPPYRELDLTATQQQRLQQVMEEHRPQFEAVFAQTLPRVREIQEQVDREMDEVLTPEQRQKLARLKAQGPRRFHPRGMGPEGPPGAPPGAPPGEP